MPRTVCVAVPPPFCLIPHVADIDSDAPGLLLLPLVYLVVSQEPGLPTSSQHLSNSCCECGLPMINMPNSSNINIRQSCRICPHPPHRPHSGHSKAGGGLLGIHLAQTNQPSIEQTHHNKRLSSSLMYYQQPGCGSALLAAKVQAKPQTELPAWGTLGYLLRK